MKPSLKLKPVEIANDETLRIYGYVSNAVDGFNNYVGDFFESVAIISEKREASIRAGKIHEANEYAEEVSYLLMRIEELSQAMQMIAAEMDTLVEYSQAETLPAENQRSS